MLLEWYIKTITAISLPKGNDNLKDQKQFLVLSTLMTVRSKEIYDAYLILKKVTL